MRLLVRGMGWLVRCIPGGEGDFVGTVSITTNATGGRARLPAPLPSLPAPTLGLTLHTLARYPGDTTHVSVGPEGAQDPRCARGAPEMPLAR